MDKCEWDIMCEIEIFLKKEIGPDLGSRQKIESIFMNIDSNAERVIFNFKGIEFMGRTFAQEYLNRKHASPFEVEGRNMPEDVGKMFEIILKLNGKDYHGQI